MAEPVTMDTARKLRTQDCPLPSLAGPAIKLLFERIEFLEDAIRAACRTLERDADEHGVGIAMRLALSEDPPASAHTTICAGELRAIGEQMALDGARLQAADLTLDELVAIGRWHGMRLTPHLEAIHG